MYVKLNILVVEDNGRRIKTFLNFLNYHELTITDNSYDAIECLQNNMFDIIYVDHRLGEDNGTGRDVVDFISTLGYEPEVIFHSLDLMEYHRCRKILPFLKYKPFNSEEFFLLEHAIYD